MSRKESFYVKGTTKLRLGDPDYFSAISADPKKNRALKKKVFDDNVSAAPLGYMSITEDSTLIEVNVFTSSDEKDLEVYKNDRYFKDKVKQEGPLVSESGRFVVETKFGQDEFVVSDEGEANYFAIGHFVWCKQYYGMQLHLWFDPDLCSFDDIKERMLKLFPIDKSRTKVLSPGKEGETE